MCRAGLRSLLQGSAPSMIITSPARYRPVQVHHDAGGAAPVSECPGRIPLQVPQPWRAAGAVVGEIGTRSARCAACSFRCRTGLPALAALHQERFVRFPGPVPLNEKYITITPQPSGEIEIVIRGPGCTPSCSRFRCWRSSTRCTSATRKGADFPEGRRRLEAKIAALQADGLGDLKHCRLRHPPPLLPCLA